MNDAFIFGAGKSGKAVIDAINFQDVNIVGLIDNNQMLEGQTRYGVPIFSTDIIQSKHYDFIIIASIHFENIEMELLNRGVLKEKIVKFYELKTIFASNDLNILFINQWRITALNTIYEQKLNKMTDIFNLKLNNMKYELKDQIDSIALPIIHSGEEAISLIVYQHKSLVRFGDGEFEILLNRNRPEFQVKTQKLTQRLQEIIKAKDERIIIAIADNYGSLDKYTDEAAYAIRSYLKPEVRLEHMQYIDLDRIYFDAYLTRPYMIYRNKNNVSKKFRSLQKIWEKKDIVIVEGDGSRIGIGNDLLKNVSTIQRIIAPSKNAFSKYEEIVKISDKIGTEMNQQGKEPLFLIALGPTATVLAFDLTQDGYQAIDIGHVDIEYEWYRTSCEERIDIPGKSVNEVRGGDRYDEIINEEYINQIYARCD